MLKLLKTKYKRGILQSGQRKRHSAFEGAKIICRWLLQKWWQVRRKWNGIFKVWKKIAAKLAVYTHRKYPSKKVK